MPRYRRPHIPGATIFFTAALARRGSTLLLDEIHHLRAAVQATLQERPFHIDAWVVLPDHLHCIWTLPDGDRDFSTRWGAIKSRFTRSLRDTCRVGFHPTLAKKNGYEVGWNPTLRRSESKVMKGDAGIWQRRFYEHHIRNQNDFNTHLRYCWTNPVKHGFTETPTAWPHSSIHRDIQMGRCDPQYAGETQDGDFGEP